MKKLVINFIKRIRLKQRHQKYTPYSIKDVKATILKLKQFKSDYY